MTFREYRARVKAFQLRMVDLEMQMHKQAWYDREVNAKKEVGKKQKYVYTNFKKFYDYDAEVRRLETGYEKQRSKFDGIGSILKGDSDNGGL